LRFEIISAQPGAPWMAKKRDKTEEQQANKQPQGKTFSRANKSETSSLSRTK